MMNNEDDLSKTRSQAWRDAIRATIEDYIKSSRNICIGDGPQELLIPILDAIDVHVHAQSLIDVAFMATTTTNNRLLKERDLPMDFTVNFKRTIDVYVTPVTKVDNDLNVALHSEMPAVEAVAISLADCCVFLVDEEDFRGCANGLPSICVQFAPFLPDVSARMLQGDAALKAAGVQAITVRDDDPTIADVFLRPGTVAGVVYDELRRHAGIVGVALCTPSQKNTILVAARSGSPFDISPAQTTLARFPSDRRRAAVSDIRKAEALNSLPGWRLLRGQVDSLAASLVFPNVVLANAFVRVIHNLARSTNHHPEIRQNFSTVRICLSSYDAGGITELDILMAQELSRTHQRLSCMH